MGGYRALLTYRRPLPISLPSLLGWNQHSFSTGEWPRRTEKAFGYLAPAWSQCRLLRMSKITGQAHSGHFTVNGRKLSGTLKEAGEKSELHLFDPVFWHMQDADMACIYGSLHDLTKVSLFANNGGNPGSQHKSGGTMYFAHAFPHYIISGDYHLHPADKVIKRISFHLNDAEMLFYDMDAFGQVIKGEKFIDDLVNEKALTRQRTIPTGLHPEIFYFTGVFEILKIVTPIGTVTANHSFTNKWPGPWGILCQKCHRHRLGIRRDGRL